MAVISHRGNPSEKVSGGGRMSGRVGSGVGERRKVGRRGGTLARGAKERRENRRKGQRQRERSLVQRRGARLGPPLIGQPALNPSRCPRKVGGVHDE